MFKLVNGREDIQIIHGYKIHISATFLNYKEIFHLVYPVLMDAGVTFKYIEKDDDIISNFSEHENPAESGKYFTIYPKSRQNCLELLELLYSIIPNDYPGIYILSDRSYKDSQTIFYRYGFFKHPDEYLKDGVPTLIGPQGEIWQDYQKPYFDLPSWIEDLQEAPIFHESDMAKKYEITQLLRQANGGNIYRAKCIDSQKSVIIKEVRPNIVVFGNVDKKQLRENEYQCSKYLSGSNFTPQPLNHVKEWINDYYVYEAIEGHSLREYTDHLSMFSFDSSTPKRNIEKFRLFLRTAKELLELVQYFHQHNIVLNDIHADNFIRDKDGNWCFIDLENSYSDVKDNLVGIHNEISLKEWNKVEGRVADCHKVGNLLLYLLGRLQMKLPGTYHPDLTSDLLHYYGISTDFPQVISYLFSSDARASEAILRLEQLEIRESSVKYELDLDLVKGRLEPISIEDLLDKHSLKPFLDAKDDTSHFRSLIRQETNLGLDGLSGILVLMRLGHLPSRDFSLVKQKIIDGIVDTEAGVALSCGPKYASPYLSSGTAGFLNALLFCGELLDERLIMELSKALLVEFAQYSDYREGMLGITDVLLKIYQQYGGEKILYFVEKQLLTTGIKAKYDSAIQYSYLYMLSRYRSMINESIIQE